MNESIEQQKESLENIINAVTAKEDVVLSLEESKKRLRDKRREVENPLQEISISYQDQKRLHKFLKRSNSAVFVMGISFLKGFFFAAGILSVLYLNKILSGPELLTLLTDLFARAAELLK